MNLLAIANAIKKISWRPLEFCPLSRPMHQMPMTLCMELEEDRKSPVYTFFKCSFYIQLYIGLYTLQSVQSISKKSTLSHFFSSTSSLFSSSSPLPTFHTKVILFTFTYTSSIRSSQVKSGCKQSPVKEV